MEMSNRVVARIEEAMTKESDRWKLDDLNGALQIVLLAAGGSAVPHLEAYYRTFGVHPDKVWQK